MKFVSVGLVNTVLDLAVLNILILVVGLGANGEGYTFFKIISFLVAVVNSYFFNKYWVFPQKNKKPSTHEGALFLLVSLVSLVINVIVAAGLFTALLGLTPGHPQIMATLSALGGTLATLLFNFIGYKLFVFKN
jgi:putative flippase GtrA